MFTYLCQSVCLLIQIGTTSYSLSFPDRFRDLCFVQVLVLGGALIERRLPDPPLNVAKLTSSFDLARPSITTKMSTFYLRIVPSVSLTQLLFIFSRILWVECC